MKTIYTFGISLFALVLFSCTSEKSSDGTEKQDPAVNTAVDTAVKNKPIGGDKDEFGCLTSAGYSWSVLKQDCIRPFDLETKMKDLRNSNYVGYVLFSEDNKQVELFAIKLIPSLVLTAEAREIYSSPDKKYRMERNAKNHWIVSITENGTTTIILQQE